MTHIRWFTVAAALGSLLATVAVPAFAGDAEKPGKNVDNEAPPRAERLINLDTPVVPMAKTWSFGGDIRFFRAQEDLTYGTIQLGYGLKEGIGVYVRGAFGE